MPQKARDAELVNRFLEELSATLDIRKTIEKLGIPEKDARAMLKGLITPVKPAQADLFGAVEKLKKPSPVKGVYEIRVDGASRGNPGEAGAGAVIKDPHGNILKGLKKYLGKTTNNVAEYSALVMALETAGSLDIKELKVLADSELMVKQINGVYKVKSEDLRPLFERAKELIRGFKSFKIAHVYREENALADKLANEAIEGKGKR